MNRKVALILMAKEVPCRSIVGGALRLFSSFNRTRVALTSSLIHSSFQEV